MSKDWSAHTVLPFHQQNPFVHDTDQLTSQDGIKWKIDSWHDCPLVQIGHRVFGVSSALLTLSGKDDYMLRVAVLNDQEQYDRVSGLREPRMIADCENTFRRAGWAFTPHYLLTDPTAEIDGYAARNSDIVIVQLKSTLRPQSPWEVYKRNEDMIDGIAHTEKIVNRINAGATGIVVTDGYEGDYTTWTASLRTGVPVATLEDVEQAPTPRLCRAGTFPTAAAQPLTSLV